MAKIDGLDGLCNIEEKHIYCLVSALDFYNRNKLASKATSLNWSKSDMLQALAAPLQASLNEYKRTFVFEVPKSLARTKSGNKASPAIATYVVTMGLALDESHDFELSSIGESIANYDLSISSYALILLSKIGVYVERNRITNLLTAVCKYAYKHPNAKYTKDIIDEVIKNVNITGFIDSRNDIAFNALVLSGILSLASKESFVINPKCLELVKFLSTYGDGISGPNDNEKTFMGDIRKGILEIISYENLSLFLPSYKDLLRIKFDSKGIINAQIVNVESRQVIYYGAPGTGKSYKIKGLVNEGNHVRTTFHPDSDYASFVGAYKPTMIEISSRDMAGHVILDKGVEVKEKKIVYEFVAQAFLQAYTEAWKRHASIMTDKEGKNVQMSEDADEKYYLVIEEINRGNCAQIFGDLFQLLDRDDNGESSYAIRPDQDMKRYLAEQFKDIEALPEAIRRGEEMKLPSNLYIFATMNTSDQSLFPIDSAFKRRWDWEYVPIKDEEKGYYIKVGDAAYLWNEFLEKINDTILRVTQSDDKQMGYWFVHLPEGQKEISTDKFVSKVLFYLWNDVFKDFGDGEDTIFIGEKADGTKYELRFKSFFGDERNERIRDLMRYNKVEPTEIEEDFNQSENQSHEQGKKLKLRITMSNGEVIDEKKVVDSYLKFFEYFNPDNISNLDIKAFNLPLISPNKHEGPNVSDKIQQKQLNNGWWVVCGNNATGYKRILDKIIKGLNDSSVTEVYEV